MVTERKVKVPTKRNVQDIVPKSRTKKILGTLNKDELLGLQIAMRAVNDIRAEVNSKNRQLGLIEAGYNAYAVDIQQKYNLPEEFSVDMKTGKLGKKGVF